MLEAVWPSPKSRGKRRWIKLRNVVMGAAKIRRSVGRISRSVYSNSGSDCDRSSHISIDSYLEDHVDKGGVSMAGSALCKLMYTPTTTVVLADELSADIGGLAMGVHTASLDDRTSTGQLVVVFSFLYLYLCCKLNEFLYIYCIPLFSHAL